MLLPYKIAIHIYSCHLVYPAVPLPVNQGSITVLYTIHFGLHLPFYDKLISFLGQTESWEYDYRYLNFFIKLAVYYSDILPFSLEKFDGISASQPLSQGTIHTVGIYQMLIG